MRFFRGNIRRKLLMLLLTTGVISFFSLGFPLLYNFYEIREETLNSGAVMGESVADYTERFTAKRTREQMLRTVKDNAEWTDEDIINAMDSAKLIIEHTRQILTHPEKYLPRDIRNIKDSSIPVGEPFIVYAPETEGKMDPAIYGEARYVSNVSDTLFSLASLHKNEDYTCYFVSKNGYTIYANNSKNGEPIKYDDLIKNYDPRLKSWYNMAKETGKPTISDVFSVSEGGELGITCVVPCYVNGEFVGVAGVGYSVADLNKMMMVNRNLGETYVNFAINQKGRIILSSEQEGMLAVTSENADLRQSADEGLAMAAQTMMSQKEGIIDLVIQGREYYLAYAFVPVSGWICGSLVEKKEVIAPAKEAKENILAQAKYFSQNMRSLFLKDLFHMSIIFIITLILLVYLSHKAAWRMVKPILSLNDGVKEIAKGNLDRKLSLNSEDELSDLADSVNDMTRELKKYIHDLSKATAEKERISAELSLAANIQTSMLPHVFPPFPDRNELDLYGSMTPAKEVGGDFYDFYLLDHDHLAVTIADVSGKGMGAALFAVTAKTILKNNALSLMRETSGADLDWSVVITRTNRQLCENNDEMMFVTVFFGVLNLKGGEFSYVNGGHNPPLVIRNNEFSSVSADYIQPKVFSHMLGVLEKAGYEMGSLVLNPGDMIFLYTDGVTEAMNSKHELYSEERLQKCLNQTKCNMPSKDILDEVRKDVANFSGDEEQTDDITMLGIRFRG